MTKRLRTGRDMPMLGLGTWQLTDGKASEIVALALQHGYRLVDTSGDYQNQAQIGKGIKASDLDREDIFVVTKVEENEDAYKSTKSNLRELGLDYADLVLIHRPPQNGAGVELWQHLIKARDKGLTRDIGVSNYTIDDMEELADATGEVPAVNQIEWTPYGYSREMLNYCEDNNIIIMAYSPLTRQERLDEPIVQQIAEKYGKTPAQIMIRWDLQQGIVPIPKASSQQHITENFDVFDFEIKRSDMSKLNALNEHYSSLGSLQYV